MRRCATSGCGRRWLWRWTGRRLWLRCGGGSARLADTLLPPGHWARANDAELAQYPHDPARAAALLEAAGYPAGKDGVRLRLTLKISTDETTRLLAAVLQQQLRAAGIVLNIRAAEFGTFYADVTQGRVPDVHPEVDWVE